MINTFEQRAGTGPVRPSRYWYLLAGGLLAVAVTCLTVAVLGVRSWDRQIQDFQRVPVPGSGEVRLTQPGEYIFYVETRGTCCSWTVGSQDGPLPGWSMRLAMEPVAGGQEAPVRAWTGTPMAYSVGGHQGLTAMSVTITRPGTYLIETGNVRPASVTDLAVGRNILGATLLPLPLFLAGLAVLLGAVVAVVVIAVRRGQTRRRAGQPVDVTGPGPWSPAGGVPAPVLVGFAGPARQSRATVLFRAILAVPALICLYFVRYATGVILVTGWFGALFTGRLPGYAASFLGGFQRWEVRTQAYLLLLTDKYPPFGLRDADYPVAVTISPGRLNRAAVLFRVVLVIPAWVVAGILWYGLGPILMLPTWLIVLIRGSMPQPLYEAIAASLRYWARVKAYWYLLTGVYPGGLFGDPAGAAPGSAVPAATWAATDVAQPATWAAPDPRPASAWAMPDAGPPAAWSTPDAGPPAAWGTPELSEQAPLPPGPAPTGQPVPLPAEAVLRAVPHAAAAAPGRLVLSPPGRLVLSPPGKRLVGLILGIGAATPVALFTLLLVLAALTPPAGPAPGSVAAAAVEPSASAGPPAASPDPTPPSSASSGPANPAPAPSSAPSGPARSTAAWLRGLSSLNAAMNRAMGAGSQVITDATLRSAARQLARCPAELSALGPPTAQLRQVDRLAVRACRGYKEGARYFAVAARFIGPDGSATDQARVNKLLDRGDAGVNRGNNLLSIAVADGSVIGPG